MKSYFCAARLNSSGSLACAPILFTVWRFIPVRDWYVFSHLEGFPGKGEVGVCGRRKRESGGRLEKIFWGSGRKAGLMRETQNIAFQGTAVTRQRLRVWHLLWGNDRQRPKESTKTRTKLMLEGIGDEYRRLVGLDGTCEGKSLPAQKRGIGCTNRRCQKLAIARSELVWCQSVKYRCGRQSTRTEGRSLAQGARSGVCPDRKG